MEGIEKETEGMGAKDIPEVGKIYHVFDDGKITWSRHFLVKCKAVIPLKQLATDPQYAKVYEAWKNRGCDWLYADTTDYVIVCEDIEDSVSEGILRGDDGVRWRQVIPVPSVCRQFCNPVVHNHNRIKEKP